MLEGDDSLVWLAHQHGAVGCLHLNEGRRAVAGEDAVLLILILRNGGECSGRVKRPGAASWIAGQRMASRLLAKRQRTGAGRQPILPAQGRPSQPERPWRIAQAGRLVAFLNDLNCGEDSMGEGQECGM